MSDKIKVFLCYAKVDREKVIQFHDKLKKENFDPWFDEEKLLPGQKWEPAIKRAIRESDFFIACLSNDSVKNRGFRHREITRALEVLEEHPESAIYLIPARLENCEVPDRLCDFLWVDVYTEKGFNKLLTVLKNRRSNSQASNDFDLNLYNRDKLPKNNGVNADIYTHATKLTQKEAITIKNTLENAGIPCQIYMHRDPKPPDAVFIGALIGAREARIALLTIPYQIKYIFRPDYPQKEGGDSSGMLIGIGYMSTHYQRYRGEKSEPVQVLSNEISCLTEEGLSNVEFQRRLREITLF